MEYLTSPQSQNNRQARPRNAKHSNKEGLSLYEQADLMIKWELYKVIHLSVYEIAPKQEEADNYNQVRKRLRNLTKLNLV